jgi:hypothetical protein
VNRAILPNVGGGFVLRPGRHYRMLIVLTFTDSRETSDRDVADTLEREGFQDAAVSTPQDWAAERASLDASGDPWPDEPKIELAANEVLVRAKGGFFGRGPELFDRDRPIDPGDTVYTVCACWDCGPATRRPGERTGKAAEPDRAKEPSPSKLLALGVLGAVGTGIFLLARSGQKEAREEETLARLEQKRERGELEERIAGYLAGGATQEQAERLAERHLAADAARQLARDLDEGGELR